MIFAFTSTSSAATIPLSKECADELGAESDVSSFVIPLGATINMDGTAIYQCVATIFLATCCGMTLTLGQMVTIVVTATLASIGTAGTPGAGMIMLAMVLEAMNIPVDMIMLIYGIDRLFDMGRTCLNITGDISCALLRDRSGRARRPRRLPSKFSRCIVKMPLCFAERHFLPARHAISCFFAGSGIQCYRSASGGTRRKKMTTDRKRGYLLYPACRDALFHDGGRAQGDSAARLHPCR